MPTNTTQRAELGDLPLRRYRAIPKPVEAVRLSEPSDVPNPFGSGGAYHGEPGDWKITYGVREDGSTDEAICSAEIFARTYEHVGGDRYQKKVNAEVEAARLEAPLDINTSEGPAHGDAGDWLLLDAEGNPYFSDDGYFRASYAPAD